MTTGPTDPVWLAARYHLRLPVARALVRDHYGRQWRRYAWLAVPTVALWLLGIADGLGMLAVPRPWNGLVMPAALLLLGLHLWLARRAARVAIAAEAARLARGNENPS